MASDDSTTTSTGTTSPTNPAVNTTLSKLLGSGGGVQGLFDAGPTYTPPGSTTTGAQSASLAAAANPTYGAGINGALGLNAAQASGQNVGTSDPTYQALRANNVNDALTTVNSSFNNSGLFGTDTNQKAAGEGVANAMNSLDYGQYLNGQQQTQQATQNLPSLFSALQAPSATAGAIGTAQDAATQAQANSKLSLLSQLSSILGGTAGTGGTTSTTTQPSTPWWQSALGLGVGLL